jgi:acylphosphatase
MKEIHALISGRVQGVCFRYYTRQMGRQLGVRGWVRNRTDSRVEVVASGPEDAMDAFERWLSTGPPMAQVSDVEIISREQPVSQIGFEITGDDDDPA